MKRLFKVFRQLKQQPAAIACCAGLIAALSLATPIAGQAPTTSTINNTPPATKMAAPQGYTLHQSVDLGGRIMNPSGSSAMYSTLVNQQSGPRVLGESFEMRVLPGQKHTLVDNITAFGSGFGGDPYDFAKLNASKGKIYDFSGLFRRDRQYFDYDLLGNANIPGGQTIATGPSNAPTGSFLWPQELQSPFLFNTVRRMTDTSLTIYPLAKVTYRFGYSQNVFEGPSLSPSGYGVAKYDALLEQYQRNSSDDFTGGVDWKPFAQTKLSFEEEVNHYKNDSYFILAPSAYNVQEADGLKVALNDYDSQTPYKPSSACNANSVGPSPATYFSAPQTAGGLPVVNAACAVVASYQRTAPTRILIPTEILSFQSSSIKNLALNGNFRYTSVTMTMPLYTDSVQELSGTTRAQLYTATGNAQRKVVAFDVGALWQVAAKFTLAEQLSFSDIHQPGTTTMLSGVKLATPATAGNETITYAGALITTTLATGAGTIEGSGSIGIPLTGYLGLKSFTNNLTGSWEVSPRATVSLTYRHGYRLIGQGSPDNAPLAVGATSNGTVTINEDGGIFNAAVRPAKNWNLNGTVEVLYADNAFTPMGARQTRHYRVHTIYKPKPWATFTGAYNDLERHNNTNNNQAAVAAGYLPYEGPLDHVDHSRVASAGVVLTPNEHYGFDFNYAYSDVFTATNICYDNGASATLPGTASLNSSGTANVCPGVFARGSTTQLADWFARDFMDAPTQFVSAALILSPVKTLHTNFGYRISDVNGTQFFNDARGVNGSLVSKYQSPYFSLAWTIHPGLTWRAEYNYYGYGEGGPSGPQYCSTSTSLTSAVVPCASLSYPTGLTEPSSGLTAARNFHANNVMLGVHYEF